MQLGYVLAGALALAAAAPVAATTTLTIKQGGLFNYATVNVSGSPVGNGNVLSGNFRILGDWGGSKSGTFDLLAFCVDLAHTINVGLNVLSPLSPNLNYKVGTLATAPGGGALTPAQIQQMEGLAAEGFKLIKLNDPGLATKIPAIQAAIWSIEYGATVTSTNPTINSLISSYIALAPSLTGKATYIFSTDTPVRQGLFVSYIPEPGTWAMLIAGFGLLGVAARRRRADVARAAA